MTFCPLADDDVWPVVKNHTWKFRKRTRQINAIIWHCTRGGQNYDGNMELRAFRNWMISINNNYGGYAGISNYGIGPSSIIEVVPPEVDGVMLMPAWSTWASDEHAVSVEVAQSNLGQVIETETIRRCVAFAEWASKKWNIPLEKCMPNLQGSDWVWVGMAGHEDTWQGDSSGKTDPGDAFWTPFLTILNSEEDNDSPMAPYERGLLAISYGDPTVMSTAYDGLDKLGYFDAINASDGPAAPFLDETDPVLQLNNCQVRRNRIAALACDTVNGPPAWEAVN